MPQFDFTTNPALIQLLQYDDQQRKERAALQTFFEPIVAPKSSSETIEGDKEGTGEGTLSPAYKRLKDMGVASEGLRTFFSKVTVKGRKLDKDVLRGMGLGQLMGLGKWYMRYTDLEKQAAENQAEGNRDWYQRMQAGSNRMEAETRAGTLTEAKAQREREQKWWENYSLLRQNELSEKGKITPGMAISQATALNPGGVPTHALDTLLRWDESHRADPFKMGEWWKSGPEEFDVGGRKIYRLPTGPMTSQTWTSGEDETAGAGQGAKQDRPFTVKYKTPAGEEVTARMSSEEYARHVSTIPLSKEEQGTTVELAKLVAEDQEHAKQMAANDFRFGLGNLFSRENRRKELAGLITKKQQQFPRAWAAVQETIGQMRPGTNPAPVKPSEQVTPPARPTLGWSNQPPMQPLRNLDGTPVQGGGMQPVRRLDPNNQADTELWRTIMRDVQGDYNRGIEVLKGMGLSL